uniref:Uncharacterized protein n=1 Tax=Anguilla anguilla TaxID=7936 RepID=A0A0E9S9F0_ANGAN
MMRPSGRRYRINKMGPRTDPCGTLHVTGWVSDLKSPRVDYILTTSTSRGRT